MIRIQTPFLYKPNIFWYYATSIINFSLYIGSTILPLPLDLFLGINYVTNKENFIQKSTRSLSHLLLILFGSITTKNFHSSIDLRVYWHDNWQCTELWSCSPADTFQASLTNTIQHVAEKFRRTEMDLLDL